ASTIGVNAGAEADVGAVVVRDDRTGGVPEELRRRRGAVRGVGVRVGFVVDLLEAVGRVVGGSAAAQGGLVVWHGGTLSGWGLALKKPEILAGCQARLPAGP